MSSGNFCSGNMWKIFPIRINQKYLFNNFTAGDHFISNHTCMWLFTFWMNGLFCSMFSEPQLHSASYRMFQTSSLTNADATGHIGSLLAQNFP